MSDIPAYNPAEHTGPNCRPMMTLSGPSCECYSGVTEEDVDELAMLAGLEEDE